MWLVFDEIFNSFELSGLCSHVNEGCTRRTQLPMLLYASRIVKPLQDVDVAESEEKVAEIFTMINKERVFVKVRRISHLAAT